MSRTDVVRWRDISTAPRDGTIIDIWSISRDGKGERWANARWGKRRIVRTWTEHEGWLVDVEELEALLELELNETATHWMPLPTPPSSQYTPEPRDSQS